MKIVNLVDSHYQGGQIRTFWSYHYEI